MCSFNSTYNYVQTKRIVYYNIEYFLNVQYAVQKRLSRSFFLALKNNFEQINCYFQSLYALIVGGYTFKCTLIIGSYTYSTNVTRVVPYVLTSLLSF